MKLPVEQIERINTDLGTVTSGHIKNAGNTAAIRMSGATALPTTNFIDFTATGTDPFLKHPGAILRADGTAEFTAVTIGAQTPIVKTLRIPHTEFVPYDRNQSWQFAPGFLRRDNADGIGTGKFSAPVVLPKGVTITGWSMYCYRNYTGDTIDVGLNRCASGTYSNISTLTAASSGAWETVTATGLSEAVASNHYSADLRLIDNNAGGACVFAFIEVTYTMPSYDYGL